MDVQLQPVAEIPLGIVTSSVLRGERLTSEEEGTPSETLVAVCPTGRLLAFITSSYKAQFVFLEGGPLHSTEQDNGEVVSYRNTFEGLLDVPRDPDSPKPRPKATSAVIIPIAFEMQSGSVQRSSIVMVGFSDGYIRGYSKSGQRVFSRLMHLEPVTKLTCMASSTVQRPALVLNNLVVLYRGCTVCVVEGWSIIEVIKATVADIKSGGGARGVDRMEEGEGGASLLKYKKWNLKDQTVTNDLALLAHTTPSSFDHLCEASNIVGFDAMICSAPVPEARLITVGENPMIALYKITKDAGHINMSEVMQVMASKMTSAVLGRLSKAGGWLGWGGGASKPKPLEERMEISSNLPMSTNIPDYRRSILSVCVSPLGNLAAMVDCFGRVLLLDCEALVIRRMWKGYRDAQCGWSLVFDNDDTVGDGKAVKSSRRRGSGSSRTSKSSSSLDGEGLAGRKKAQCLCIYAPRRGILELWPVQSGSRVAAVPVGKGCRLLYASHGPFITSTLSESSGKLEQKLRCSEQERLPRVRDNLLVLFPDGSIATLFIPFPVLVRLADPTSFDTHLMKKLPLAIQSGDSDMILQVVQCVKSSQSLKKAVDVIIEAHPHQSISSRFLTELLNIALSRLTPQTDDPTLLSLHEYISGVRQLVQFVCGVQSLPAVESSQQFTADKLKQHLSDLCGISAQLAKSTADILYHYFTSFTPQRRVVKEMGLKSLIKCFKLPSKIGNVVISSFASSSGCCDNSTCTCAVERSISDAEAKEGHTPSCSSPVAVVELSLREGLSSLTLLDLGCSLFLPMLSRTVAPADVTCLFCGSGLQPIVCLSVLSSAFLNGSLRERNPCALLQRLNTILSAIFQGSVTSTLLSGDLLLQCSQTHCAGHALLLALLSQKFASICPSTGEVNTGEEAMDITEKSEDLEAWEELESWESVSSEKEQWIRLIHCLEGLCLLSNAVGQAHMRKLPPAPWTEKQQRVSEESEAVEGEDISREERLSVGNHQFILLSDVMKGGVSAAALESYGPGLVAHCIAKWFTENRIPAYFIARMPSDPNNLPDGDYSKVVYQFGQLLRLLPNSLSHQSLLVHSAWQAASLKKYQLCLDFVSQLGNLNYLTGTLGFLWHYVFESETVRTIDAVRKGAVVDSTSVEAITVSRNIFAYLYELTLFEGELKLSTTDEPLKDVLTFSRKPGKLSLLEIILSFPLLAPTMAKTYFELMLLTEVVLHLKRPINVVSFFPTWLRSALKKGAFKSAWQEQVSVQLQQKRQKFLCECIKGVLRETTAIKMTSTWSSMALKELRITVPSISLAHLELADLDDFVFLLGDLWGLDIDNIRVHWLSNLFGAGKETYGKKIFLGIDDKTKASHELLPVAGVILDHIIKNTEPKVEELTLRAQIPPTLLQWLKKQSSSGKLCDLIEPSWKSLYHLVTMIQPYIMDTPNADSICRELETLIRLSQNV